MNTLWNWLLLSSANPNESSLTIKMLLTAQIPMVVSAIAFGCTFHVACAPVTSDQLLAGAQDVVNVFFYVFTTVSYIIAAVAFIRKLYLTIRGQHAGLK